MRAVSVACFKLAANTIYDSLAYSVHSYTNQCIKHVRCQTPDTTDQFTSQPVATRRATLLITHSSLPLLQR